MRNRMTSRSSEVSFETKVIAATLATHRPSQSAQEREILRVVSAIAPDENIDVFEFARREALKWARNRAGALLPAHAWQGAPFEVLAAGRTTIGANIESGGSIIWSLRGDDPDKSVPGRIWSTEVTLGKNAGSSNVLLGVRLLVSFVRDNLQIEPAVPGLVLQIASTCAVHDGLIPVSSQPHFPNTEDDFDILSTWLTTKARKLPIILASGDERSSTPDRPFSELSALAKALCGLAHVVFLPAPMTYKLSESFGKSLAVFHGGLRIYYAGFDRLADPRDHPLYLERTLGSQPKIVASEIRSNIARESLRLTRLGHDVLSFAAVRSASLRMQHSAQSAENATEREQLVAANKRNEALEAEVQGLQAEADQALELSLEEANRAENAERQLASAWARIEQLESVFSTVERKVSEEVLDPTSWEDFVGWCDKRFSSRLSLAPSARRSARNPIFPDYDLATRCVQWLVDEARTRFIEGGGTLANIPIFEGVINAPCGRDEYQFYFQGRRLQANWHIKNGGNTRQPERCLRIYYCFDDVTRQIVIADMPAHRRTGAT